MNEDQEERETETSVHFTPEQLTFNVKASHPGWQIIAMWDLLEIYTKKRRPDLQALTLPMMVERLKGEVGYVATKLSRLEVMGIPPAPGVIQ